MPSRLNGGCTAWLNASIVEVPERAGEVKELVLLKVETDAQVRIWNELMEREHPRGAGPLVGVQVRYLIGSAHGWLGGLGFGASALQLKDRDRWIGWDGEGRQKHLHRIVGLSRFLIRPMVACHNLAWRVLGMALRQLPDDVERRYGYRPWLVETFVERARYRGTCYRAANWIEVGQTLGRGRQDRDNRCAETRKAIFLSLPAMEVRSTRRVVPGRRQARAYGRSGEGAAGPVACDRHGSRLAGASPAMALGRREHVGEGKGARRNSPPRLREQG